MALPRRTVPDIPITSSTMDDGEKWKKKKGKAVRTHLGQRGEQ